MWFTEENKMLISHQSGSQVVPILLTVYLFQPSTGGKVQMKEKDQTNSRPTTACFDCSRMFPRGRQITKNRSKDRTARDHSATIPEANNTLESPGISFYQLWKSQFCVFHLLCDTVIINQKKLFSGMSVFWHIECICVSLPSLTRVWNLISSFISTLLERLHVDKVSQLYTVQRCNSGDTVVRNSLMIHGGCIEPPPNGLKKKKADFNYGNKSLSRTWLITSVSTARYT